MKKSVFAGFSLGILAFGLLFNSDQKSPGKEILENDRQLPPGDWFFAQRAFPFTQINYAAWNASLKVGNQLRTKQAKNGLSLVWQSKGPENIGGRITDVEVHPSNPQIIYAGAASGGIFKSINNGQSWQPVFDNELSLSIGDIAIAPSNPDILYVGTGEANGGGGSVTYDGVGIYNSQNAGASWNYIGLPESGSFGRIAVDPQNPDIVYAAAMGRLFSNNPERGVYKSSDGGQNWLKVLFVNDSAGAIDVVIDPLHPDTVYAAIWQRTRRPGIRIYGGAACGIYRSVDGGQNWTHLTNGLSQGPDQGRIGISLCSSQPNVLYAIYADAIGYFSSVFKSTDNGNSWVQTNDAALANAYTSYGWWFGRIQADPVDPQIAYVIGFDIYKTVNGGNSWTNISNNVHVDQHCIYINPQDHNSLIIGNDGGVYTSVNQGNTWYHLNNIPITQFYCCETDNLHPERLYGGSQDNSTVRTLSGSSNGWTEIYGGDGFRVLVDPTDNNFVYAESQYGGISRSQDGGYNWLDATAGLSFSDRYNWNTPYIFDPSNPAILYLGSNNLYKSVNHGETWNAISTDLSNGLSGNGVVYGTITTISVSPVNHDVIYAGTDDGNVWVSQNGGLQWIKISTSLPLRYITSVACDPFDQAKVYVTLSGFRYDDYLSHIFMSLDFGQNWQSIAGNLPDVPVNEILPHPQLADCYFAATDIGVFVSIDAGNNWELLGTGLPNVPVTDIRYHQGTHTLIAATYGRSMFTLNVESINGLENISSAASLNAYYFNFTQSIIIEGLTNKFVDYSVYSIDGKFISQGKINRSQNTVSLNNFNTGVYILSSGDCLKKILKY